MIWLSVECYLMYQPPVYVCIYVYVLGILSDCKVCIIVQDLLQSVHVVLHVCKLLLVQNILVRLLEHIGQTLYGGLELVYLVKVCIQFHQVTAGNGIALCVGVFNLVYIHSVLVHLYLFTQIVVAHMLAIQHHLYELSSWSPRQAGFLCHSKCHMVSKHRPVHPVGQEHPALVFRHTQYGGLAVQFQRIGFLGVAPGGIATSSDVVFLAFIIRGSICIDDLDIRSFQPVGGFRRNLRPIGGVDYHRRQPRSAHAHIVDVHFSA